MPTARADLAVVALNGMLYAIGGRGADGSPLDTVEAYNPLSYTWMTEAPMPTARWGLVASVISSGGARRLCSGARHLRNRRSGRCSRHHRHRHE